MSISAVEVTKVLKLDNLYATYGEGMVLRKINLEAREGRVTCLVGRNGAGKTTTLRSIMGYVRTSGGEIALAGESIAKLPAYSRAKAGIGYVPQGREIFPQLTVEENLLIGLEASGSKGGIPESIYDTFPILKEFMHRKGGDLSGGQQQQLAIARAVAVNPSRCLVPMDGQNIRSA